jgi:hypothetical protein
MSSKPLAVSLSSFGMAVPKDISAAERVLDRLYAIAEKQPSAALCIPAIELIAGKLTLASLESEAATMFA